MKQINVCFFAEHQVGIGSIASVLERQVKMQTEFHATWCDVSYYKEGGRIEQLPGFPAALKAMLRSLLQTGNGLRKGPFDALFFLTHNPAVLRQDVLQRVPTCLWTDVTPLQLDDLASAYDHPVAQWGLVRALKRAAVTRTFRLAKRCLGWSDWARRSFVDDYGVDASRAGVVPPGIDVSLWESPRRDIDPSKPLRLAFIGGHFERKGGRLLLEAFRSELSSTCELAIATRDDVPEEPGIRVYKGLRAGSEGLRKLLRDADAFVLPTLADCHSIASLEAMAAGLPVILTRIGAAPEIVLDGQTGLLVPPGDVRALAQAVRTLVADRPRALAMGERARTFVAREFDAAVMARRIFDQLRQIADRGMRA